MSYWIYSVQTQHYCSWICVFPGYFCLMYWPQATPYGRSYSCFHCWYLISWKLSIRREFVATLNLSHQNHLTFMGGFHSNIYLRFLNRLIAHTNLLSLQKKWSDKHILVFLMPKTYYTGQYQCRWCQLF